MRKREKRNMAILLSVAMLFSMNISTAAQEITLDTEGLAITEDAAAEEISGEFDTAEEAGAAELTDADGDGYVLWKKSYEKTVELEGGWNCEIASANSAEVSFSEGKCLIEPKKLVKRLISDRICRSGYDIDLCFNGSIDSEDLFIKTKDHCILDSITNTSYDELGKEIYTQSPNSIVFNISANEQAASGAKELKIYVQELGESVPASDAGETDGYKYCVSGTSIPCEFNLPSGFRVAKYSERNGKKVATYNDEVELDGVKYAVYTIIPAMDSNKPFNYVEKQVGNYEVGYYSNIPFFGKKIKKGKVEEVLGEIDVRDKDGNIFKVEKAKVVRMKNPPTGQGAYPTLSNAGLQITKVKFVSAVSINSLRTEKEQKKAAKEVTKALKQATKVDKKASSADSYQLPLLIYPYRLFGERLENFDGYVYLNKKRNQVKLTYFFGNKKYKIKDGKKDSFKNGTHSVKYSDDHLTVSSADAWTGPEGLSSNKITFD